MGVSDGPTGWLTVHATCGFGGAAPAGLRNTKCEKGVQIRNLNPCSAVLRSLSLASVTQSYMPAKTCNLAY